MTNTHTSHPSPDAHRGNRRLGRAASPLLAALAGATMLSACASSPATLPREGATPLFSFPVTSNDTPYSKCLAMLGDAPGRNLPTFAVGEVADKTGQINYQENGHALSQGVTEMVISALFKSRKASLVERFDLRVVNAELALKKNRLIANQPEPSSMSDSNFLVIGALTELNYNILSEGAGLWVKGIGAGSRAVIINVALDLRVIKSDSLEIAYVSSLQKQIYGREIQANVFSFFGTTLVEFDAGRIRNEPLQLGVRSVVEMAVYQIMTDFLGLPVAEQCELVRTDPPQPPIGKKR